MERKDYRPRLIDNIIDSYLKAFGAVCVEGPKWCGKTWTSSYHCQSEIMLGNPDGNFQNRQLAQMSPSLVLEGETPRLIDEWQEVPQLWDAVRYKVDQNGNKGQFILTGSATPNHKGILHSGAGRIAKLRMRPMSLFESGNSSGDISLKDICEGRIEPKILGEVDLRKLIDFIIRGGWPANQETTLKQAAYLPIQYIQAVLDDDVYRIDNVKRDKHKMELLLRSLARNEATTVTNKKLKNDIKEIDNEDIDVETVAAYLDVFQRLFLTDNQKPFEAKLRSSIRIKQAEKRHLSDPSLAAALLNATPEMLLNDLNTLGFLFEALCERDLKIYAESFDAELYHYQDYNNNEMDAVIAMPDGKWCGFEIKLGANQIDMAAENLIKIKNEIKASGGIAPDSLCVICGLSNAAYQRPDGVFVVPITALRN
jgi:predicted AAA+ superfamily ATPase|uniref:ATP-binding protein n=1 Tax=Lachnospira eligens TaxID=39485 RepID=UPI003FED6CCD